MSNRLSLIFLLASLLVWSTASADNTAIKFINDWKWEGQAAPLLLTLDKGYFAEEGLDVTLAQGEGSLEAIPKIATGDFQMGSVDINALVKWRTKNPWVEMKAVYIIYNAAPFAVLGRPSLGVVGPTDLHNHKLGAPEFDDTFAHWDSFVEFNGIKTDKVDIENVSFDNRESALAAGKVDAITGSSFTSYVTLLEQGVPSEDISLMLMNDFGLDLYGNAVIVNPRFAKDNPEAVKAFVKALVRGYQETIANPSSAIEHVLDRVPDANSAIELQRLIMAIGHHIATSEVRSRGLGDVVDSRLEQAIEQLGRIYKFIRTPSVKDVFDDRFLPAFTDRQLQAPQASTEIPVLENSSEVPVE